jgi:hypothetical protein
MTEYFVSPEYADLKQVAVSKSHEYQNAEPFPSISFNNFFAPAVVDSLLEEFPDLSKGDAERYNNAKEVKLAGKGEDRFGIETKKFMHFLNSQPFLEFLQVLTGIEEKLLGDPYYWGGGMHEIKRGGLLKIHADFNKHPDTHLDRRINVLLYLNKDWHEEYGGHFELWDTTMEACRKRILPEFNTMAIFSTTDFSYHGHPNPLTCPEGRSRKSLALYYYSNGRPAREINADGEGHSTLFRERRGYTDDKEAFSFKNSFTMKGLLQEITPPIIVKAAKKILK